MVKEHHGVNGHEFEQIQVDSEGLRSLACYGPQDHKELDTTQQLNDIFLKFKPGKTILW